MRAMFRSLCIAPTAAREVDDRTSEEASTRSSENSAPRHFCQDPQCILSDTLCRAGKQRQYEEPCSVLQGHMALDLSSLRVVPTVSGTADNLTLLKLTFVVNTLVPLTVHVYWLATEEWDATDAQPGCPYPRFVSPVSISRLYDIEPGHNQQLALPRADWLDPKCEPYQTMVSPDWQARNNLHPVASAHSLIIELVRRQPTSERTKTAAHPNSQISYIELYKDGPTHVALRCVKQKVCVNGTVYLQHKIFSPSETLQSRANPINEVPQQCAVCLSHECDAMMLPCRHLCMCRDCASTHRQHSNKCPICRTVVEAIMHIRM
ncbi:hypothetical protein H4R26_005152 [Coemansia thaxteri]|uniref:RING-type domain-containing protein n=1 Tax=Coemansia thaxteri TaxID=2663907 RepID=A0A9W8BFN9_9FUNG|nr:hypothetical protein H4R26_005152 [Coemansia thaxteri]